MRRRLTVMALAACISLPGQARELAAQESAGDGRAQVLVLGTFHMNNPGKDVFNTEVDDVLSPKRQEEIAEVIDVLQRFRPSKIALEARFNSDRVGERYAEYLAGEHELARNEIEQLGFRLAKELGHEAVYPVDVSGEFPYPRLVKYAQATGRLADFEALQAQAAERSEAMGAYLASNTVLEALLFMNSPARAGEAVGDYFRMAELGEPWDWAGADLVSDWFRRNMRIYTNVMRLVEDEGERVLVIYGAGHLGWLQFAFDGNPNVRLRELAEFAGHPDRQ